MIIRWHKKFLDRTVHLYEEGKKVGFFKPDFWTTSAKGKLNDKAYYFRSKGVFSNMVLITDPSTNETVGRIKFNQFSSKAVLSLGEIENIKFKTRSFWGNRWSLSNKDFFNVAYRGRGYKGAIKVSNETPEATVLAGMYSVNRDWTYVTVVIVAIMVPIIFF